MKAKDSSVDGLSKLYDIDVGSIQLGDIPLDQFALDHAERAMQQLPESAKRPGTRRHYAQLINRVLALAVYPCPIIERNPLPKGFMPKVGRPPAYAYLYPAEEAKLMGCAGVPLAYRILFGFLSREGCRVSEATGLCWRELDLARRAITLDKNKTDDPRAWALNAGVARALAAWKKLRAEQRKAAQDAAGEAGNMADERVFVDEHGRPFEAEALAKKLRRYLGEAGMDRPELFTKNANRGKLRAHDLRGTFVTLPLSRSRQGARRRGLRTGRATPRVR